MMTLDKVAKMAKKGDFVIFTCHKKPRIFKEKFNFLGNNSVKIIKNLKKWQKCTFTCHKKPRIFKEKFNFLGSNSVKNMKIPKSSTFRIKKAVSEMQKSVNNVK